MVYWDKIESKLFSQVGIRETTARSDELNRTQMRREWTLLTEETAIARKTPGKH